MTTLMTRRNFSLLTAAAIASPMARARDSWRLATGYRSDGFHGINIASMTRDVALATQGSFNIEVHANSTLAKLGDVRAAVESEKAQAGETILTSMVKEMPIAGADSVPFIVSSYSDAKRMWRYQRPLLDRHFAARGLQVLYAVPWPPQGLYTNKPLVTKQDFHGSRMRTYNSTTVRIAELLGAQGVDVPMVQVGQALAQGRIDSMITSAVTGVENKVWDHVKYYYEINAWFPKNVVFANAKALQALRPEERDSLLRAAAAAEVRGWAASEAAAAQSVDELRRNGMKVERVPLSVATELKRMGERFSVEWIREVGPEANYIFVPYFTQS